MEEKNNMLRRKRFNGSAWFEKQVQMRTRAALQARGSKASTHSREYQQEYALQLSLFSAERTEKKRQNNRPGKQ